MPDLQFKWIKCIIYPEKEKKKHKLLIGNNQNNEYIKQLAVFWGKTVLFCCLYPVQRRHLNDNKYNNSNNGEINPGKDVQAMFAKQITWNLKAEQTLKSSITWISINDRGVIVLKSTPVFILILQTSYHI